MAGPRDKSKEKSRVAPAGRRAYRIKSRVKEKKALLWGGNSRFDNERSKFKKIIVKGSNVGPHITQRSRSLLASRQT